MPLMILSILAFGGFLQSAEYKIFSLTKNEEVLGNTASRLALVSIVQDEPLYDQIGYDNCDMQTNGEKMILSIIRDGDIVFDVGAHIGEWSLRALESQPNITIYGFEPIPALFDVLNINLASRPAHLNMLALSDKKGETSFIYYPELPGMSTLHQRHEIETELGLNPIVLNVRTERLDAFCTQHQISHIDFVKIDTEGNEWFVLQGAQKLLKKQAISLIQFEYGGCYLDSKTTLKQIYDYLTGYKYSIYRIAPFGLIKISSWRPELENFFYCNYLAVKNL